MEIGTITIKIKIKVNMSLWDTIKLRISGMANLFEKMKENSVSISTETENKLVETINKAIKSRKIEV